ncbi:MAG: agmatinase [Clostridiales bacterium]|nr:agmatinase [Clostridiales bacterium]
MLNKSYDAFIGCAGDYEEAKIVLFGAPFDSTTSNRPGARFGSRAIRRESQALETFSPYQNRDLCDISVFDSGDLTLAIGDTKMVLDSVYEHAKTILSDGKLPFMLGGEHLVTLGAVKAASEKYPGLHIIHFDAHADLRDDYLGVKLSHACVMRRCWDLLGDGHIHQFGIRSGDKEEFEWADKGHVSQIRFDFTGLGDTVMALRGFPIYLTVDLDILDPSEFPGTGTPEAGGVKFTQLLNAAFTVCSKLDVVACDVNELSPPCDSTGISAAAASKFTRELLLAL